MLIRRHIYTHTETYIYSYGDIYILIRRHIYTHTETYIYTSKIQTNHQNTTSSIPIYHSAVLYKLEGEGRPTGSCRTLSPVSRSRLYPVVYNTVRVHLSPVPNTLYLYRKGVGDKK